MRRAGRGLTVKNGGTQGAKSPEGATSLHARIRADVMAEIASGAWPPGYRIPYEHELLVQYGCSRMTVNKAIASLVDAGLIVRRRRAGSFVARPRIELPVLDMPDIQGEIESRGQTYRYELRARAVRAPLADQFIECELAANGHLLELDGVHFADGRPFALEHRLISLAAVPKAEDADFREVPPSPWLLAEIAWTEAKHGISAIHAGAKVSRLLGVTPSEACLQVERETWRGDQRVTFVRQIFPGDAFALFARFSPP